MNPTKVLQPQTAAQARQSLQHCREQGWSVLPRGNGSRLQRHFPSAAPDRWLSSTSMNRILRIQAEDQICEVEAGCSPATLSAALEPYDLELGTCSPGAETGTLGGLFMAPDHSMLHHLWGPPRDQVLGGRWMMADGCEIQSGSQVVKSVAGYDLTRLFLGSRGRLAFCLNLILRLRPVPRNPTWARLDREQLSSWLWGEHRHLAPPRLLFSLSPHEQAWVQWEAEPAPLLGVRIVDPEEGRSALARALETLGQAPGRASFDQSIRTSWLQSGPDESWPMIDWLSSTAACTAPGPPSSLDPSSDQASHWKFSPVTQDSPWLPALAEACAPGFPPFGQRPETEGGS